MRMTSFIQRIFTFLIFASVGISNAITSEKICNVINGSRVELPCNLDVPLTKKELEEMSWIKGPRQLISHGMYKITEDDRFSIVPPSLLKKRGFNLLIHPVTPADNGVYRCSIMIGEETHSKSYQLNVLVPPTITKAPAPILKVVEGDPLQVSCVAEGSPPPTVTWLMEVARGGIPIIPIRFSKDGFEFARDILKGLNADFVEMNGYLQISHIDRQMSGTLACQAINGVEPRAIRKMRLDIRFSPEVHVVNSLIKQSLGGDTVLQCQVNSNPMGKILWIFEKSKSPINATSCSIPTNKNVKYCIVETQLKHEERWPSVISELHILKLTEDDFGEYTCTMNTMMGKHSASTTLERYILETERSMRLFNDPFFYLPPPTTTAMPYLQYQPNLDTPRQSSYSHFRETRKDYTIKDLYIQSSSKAANFMSQWQIVNLLLILILWAKLVIMNR